MACAHVQPATVKAHAPVIGRFRTSGFRAVAPRGHRSDARGQRQSAAFLNRGARPLSASAIRNAASKGELSSQSTLIENTLEYQFCGAITSELLLRGHAFDLLRSDRDLTGYDLVIEANGVTRHIQLKAQIAGGRAVEVSAQTKLETKPSACIIWTTYDPVTLRPAAWRFFGEKPGECITPLGDRIAKHSRGEKGFRPQHRIVKANRFEKVSDVEQLVDRLFGTTDHEIASLVDHMASLPASDSEPWLEAVRAGDFTAIPAGLDWGSSTDLAHLIDGYALLEQRGRADFSLFADHALSVATQIGRWCGTISDLWIALFLEHRRWRHASPVEPDAAQRALLETLVRQLREALVA